MVNPYGERAITIASAAFIILTLVSTAHAPPSPSTRLLRSVSDKVRRTFNGGSNLLRQIRSARWEQSQQFREPEPCLRDYRFGGGDLIEGKDGTLFFALDGRWVVYMEVIDKKQATFRRVSVGSSYGGTLVKRIDKDFPFGGSKGIALAMVFVDRIVPYHRKSCNQAHYMAYFTQGEVRSVQGRSNLSKDCPLHRKNFENMRSYDISANTFYLLKGDWSSVYPSSFSLAPPPIPSNPPSPPSSFRGGGQPRPTSPTRRANVQESSTNRHHRTVSDPTNNNSRFKNFPW
nr:PREDICTED: uncharacterized protein LOC109031187 [Bemisia tabaci]